MNEDGMLSTFNEGALQMNRIDELQRRLNLLNVDSLGFNIHSMKYNYTTIFQTLNSLFCEVSSKLSEKEKIEGIRMRTMIKNFLHYKPIFYHKIETSFGRIKRVKQMNNDNWEMLQEILFHYEILIRAYLEEHNLTSPKEDQEEDWD